ncbi:hypothetical protein [Yersinia enterocolitica]|uniref:hypothetical protein n=1 Tax=Yersinia enterocolitica TaxID=630 RepID=UPI00227CD5D6|nr:hypothetical protein [Yersinia enterocolitica]MCY1686340.1 hypothetical protein [Yersinia enterocolitica]
MNGIIQLNNPLLKYGEMHPMKVKLGSKNLELLFFISLLLIFLLSYAWFDIIQNYGVDYYFVLYLNFIFIVSIFTFFIFNKCDGYISPISFFILSTIVFIMVRPVYYGFGGDIYNVITAGYGVNNINIVRAFLLTGCVINFIICFYYLSSNVTEGILKKIPNIYFYNVPLSRLTFLIGCTFAVGFIYTSFENFALLGEGNVFSAEKLGIYDDLYLFKISKIAFLLSLILAKNKNFLLYSLVIFLSSIGFILVGQRGYTIVYFFCFLFFLNLKYKVNIFQLSIIAVFLLVISSIVINYRVGRDVNSGLLRMIINPILQQGASFEVVFGVSNFKQKVLSCISYSDYFSNFDFGSCVDKSRGVNFIEGGGFSTSFFAEVIYFGFFWGATICILFGFCLSLVNRAYLKLINNDNAYAMSLIILFITPNLIYFSRSTAFDFIIKTFISILALYVIFYFKLIYTNIRNNLFG